MSQVPTSPLAALLSQRRPAGIIDDAPVNTGLLGQYTQEARTYNPTMRDRIASALLGDAPSPLATLMSQKLLGSAGAGNSGFGLADLTPLGMLMGAQEAARQGDVQGAALAMAPFGATARGLGNMTRTAGISPMNSGPKELYHVVGPEYEPGQPIRSLYSRKKEAAYDEYAQRWPEAGDLVQDHPHKVFFYDNIKDAEDHAAMFGGSILRVNPSKVDGLYLDKLEKSHGRPGFYATASDVPPDAIF